MTTLTAKDKILNASIELMTGRGYSATSVDDIIKRAGVAKGSLYHAFKSKEELAIAALEEYLARGYRIIASGPYLGIRDPVEKALAFVDHIEEKSPELWSHGCLMGSLAIEVADNYPTLMEKIDRLFNQLEGAIAGIFAPALKARDKIQVTAKELSTHLLAVIEGSIIAAKSHSSQHYLRDGIRRFRHYLALLLEQPTG